MSPTLTQNIKQDKNGKYVYADSVRHIVRSPSPRTRYSVAWKPSGQGRADGSPIKKKRKSKSPAREPGEFFEKLYQEG